MTTNGSPSWKMIALAVVTLVVMLIGNWALSSAETDREQDRRLSVTERDLATIKSDVTYIRDAVTELRRRP